MQSQEMNNAKEKVHTPDLAKEKKKPLTVTLFIGDKQVETLTAEQSERMAQRLSKTMSLYYSNNLSEYEKIRSN